MNNHFPPISTWADFYSYIVSPFVFMHEHSYIKTRGETPLAVTRLFLLNEKKG